LAAVIFVEQFLAERDFMTEARSKGRPPPRTADELPCPALATALLLAVVAAFGLHALFVSGPAMREAAEAQLARVIADEDRVGMRPGTAQFADCSRELATVRQKQSDRDRAAAASVL
jgi:hypothetical protein